MRFHRFAPLLALAALAGCSSSGTTSPSSALPVSFRQADPLAGGRMPIHDAPATCEDLVAATASEWADVAAHLGLDPSGVSADFTTQTIVVVHRNCDFLSCPQGFVGLSPDGVTSDAGRWSVSVTAYEGCGAGDCDGLRTLGTLVLVGDGKPASVAVGVAAASAAQEAARSGRATCP